MIEIQRHTLDNGLRIVHNKNAATGMVAVNLLYQVGSRNEQYEYTGMAHLLEHLMFGGSANAPCFDRILQEAGGENNAWTNNDITNYYEILPVQNIETALWIEADRMENLLLEDKALEVQRNVVQEEFKQRCLNAPYGDAGHILRRNVYHCHPYRWPVIGKSLEDIETVPKEVVRDFYHRFYVPDNAILSVVGNIDSDRLFRLVEKYFGHIAAGNRPKSVLPAEPRQTEARVEQVQRNVPHNMLIKAYRMCDRNSADYHASDMISDILSNGRSSRFYQNIYAKGNMVSSIDASITGDIDEGMLVVKAQLLPGVSYEVVEAAIDKELDMLKTQLTDVRELDKLKNRYESNALFCNINNDERAANLAYYEMLGDANMINRVIDDYRQTTPEAIRRVSQYLLDERNSTTIYYNAK